MFILALQSMWRLGVNYLSFCPSFGTAYMKHLLEQIPLESEKQVRVPPHLATDPNFPPHDTTHTAHVAECMWPKRVESNLVICDTLLTLLRLQAYKALAVCGQHNLVDQAKLLYMVLPRWLSLSWWPPSEH
jgi:hypothetical protein